MIKKTYGVLAAALLLGMASCSDDNPWLDLGEGQGAIKLSLTADGNITDAVPHTRALAFEAPDPSEFTIRLEKQDGSWTREFNAKDFDAQESFPTGIYTLTAFYGNPEEEGFEKTAFQGSEEITVLENRTTEVNVAAKVAHSLISVSYTDGYKNYLHDYSAVVQSEGHTEVEMIGDEDRPAFVIPGNVTLTLTFTNPQGQTVTIQPANFDAEAAHHYHLTFDVNGGETGSASLQISFDNGLTKEDVEIDLSDELFTSPNPTVKLSGITADEGMTPTLEFLTGEIPDGQYRFNVNAPGGLKEVNLGLKALEGSFKPSFGNVVNLIGAAESIQSQLASLGIDCKGVFVNPDRMAVIDFSGLAAKLPTGSYELSIDVVDKLTRKSDPVKVLINSVAQQVEVEVLSSYYGTNEGNLLVKYNGSQPQKAVTFKAMNKDGVFVDAPCVSCTATKAFEMKDYTYIISLPDMEQNPIKVKMFLNGEFIKIVELEVIVPDFSIEVDPFTTRSLVKVNADSKDLELITGKLSFSNINNSRIVSRDVKNGLIWIEGFSASTNYTLTPALGSLVAADKARSFTTAGMQDITNGDFSKSTTTIPATEILNGGTYGKLLTTNQNKTVISAVTPDSWANINNVTCNLTGSSDNSWYKVPSTFMQGGNVVVRSVGYNDTSNPDIAKYTGSLLGTAPYYSQNAPADANLKKASGLLSINDANVTVRPSSMTVTYSYVPYNSEVGVAEIIVHSGDAVIGKGSIDLTSGTNKTATVTVDNYTFGKKATSVEVVFKSTKGDTVSVNIPSGSALDDNNTRTSNATIPYSESKAMAIGSVLTIQNVKLNY